MRCAHSRLGRLGDKYGLETLCFHCSDYYRSLWRGCNGWAGKTTAYFDGAILSEGATVSAFAPRQLQETNINTGTATISAGNGSVVVTHGLVSIPTRVFVTMSSNPGVATSVYTTSVGATSFTIAVSTNVTNSTTFDWRAIVGEGN